MIFFCDQKVVTCVADSLPLICFLMMMPVMEEMFLVTEGCGKKRKRHR